nr:DUF6397 family protein [Streptomyces sp. REN17]
MSGDAITRAIARPTLAQSRAAREVGLKRGEFDLAVQLGRIRTVPDEGGGGRRVTRAEIDRVRSEEGFPEVLRERVKAVGTSEGAALMGITTGRFTRFARLGLIVPVKFYLNRYRAVVWLYLAEELRQFAANEENAALLSGRISAGLRDQLDMELDLRPRNWRGRHLGFSLRQTQDPWARAAVVASLLDPVQVAEIVPDPCERVHMDRYRPGQGTRKAPDSPAAHVIARIMTAADPDEISWLRADLANGLKEARAHRPAPRPATEHEVRRTGRVRPVPFAEHRLPTGYRRPAEPRRTVLPRHPAGDARPAGTPQPNEARHPTRRRPAGARHPVEVRHTADEPGRPKGILSRLRRRNP